jgi:hypothetical protein
MTSFTRASILLSALAAAAALSISASAQTLQPAATSCPATYFKMNTIWYNAVTKSVVSASAGTKDSADRKGWILGDLCQHNETGDVQIFDVAPSTGRTTAVAK